MIGYKPQVGRTGNGFISIFEVIPGNPADSSRSPYRIPDPVLLDPDTEERFSLVIESTGNLSGWVEQYGINSGGDDQTYDANLLHSW